MHRIAVIHSRDRQTSGRHVQSPARKLRARCEESIYRSRRTSRAAWATADLFTSTQQPPGRTQHMPAAWPTTSATDDNSSMDGRPIPSSPDVSAPPHQHSMLVYTQMEALFLFCPFFRFSQDIFRGAVTFLWVTVILTSSSHPALTLLFSGGGHSSTIVYIFSVDTKYLICIM